MKIIQNTLKIQKNIQNVSKKFRVGPKKVGSVGFPKTRHFFFLALSCSLRLYTTSMHATFQFVFQLFTSPVSKQYSMSTY